MTKTYRPDQQKIAEGLMSEFLDVISKYDEAIPLMIVIGVLETLKFDLIHHQHHELQKEISKRGNT